MALLNLRQAQKTPLTAAQIDENFVNLNNAISSTLDAQVDVAAAEAAAIATAADAVSTAADVVSTNADVITTNADAASTAADAISTAADVVSTAAALDEFTDLYLGSKASDPALDNDGDALQDGALYFNTTTNLLRVYDLGNTTWITGVSTASGVSAGFVIATVLALGG